MRSRVGQKGKGEHGIRRIIFRVFDVRGARSHSLSVSSAVESGAPFIPTITTVLWELAAGAHLPNGILTHRLSLVGGST